MCNVHGCNIFIYYVVSGDVTYLLITNNFLTFKNQCIVCVSVFIYMYIYQINTFLMVESHIWTG